ELDDWRDQIESRVADKVAQALQEQAYACGTDELKRIIQVAQDVLVVHPAVIPAKVALLEALSRSGASSEVERLYKEFSDDGDAGQLPPLHIFVSRRATPYQINTVRFAGREAELTSLQQVWEAVEQGF